jgi:hypothetical protein
MCINVDTWRAVYNPASKMRVSQLKRLVSEMVFLKFSIVSKIQSEATPSPRFNNLSMVAERACELHSKVE